MLDKLALTSPESISLEKACQQLKGQYSNYTLSGSKYHRFSSFALRINNPTVRLFQELFARSNYIKVSVVYPCGSLSNGDDVLTKGTLIMNLGQYFKREMPITLTAMEDYAEDLCEKYGFEDKKHATAVICNRIMHLPPDCSRVSERYLVGCVKKNLAFQCAQALGSRSAHESQVDLLVSQLTLEPTDAQASDALVAAAQQDSEYAKKACEKLGITFEALRLVKDGK